MRKRFVLYSLLMVLGWGVSAWANLLVNPGFEEGPTGQVGSVTIPGWNTWGTNGWHHNDAGAMIDTQGMKFWWDGVGIWQDFAATAGSTYDISVQVIDASRDTKPNNWDFQIEAEFYNAANVQLAAVVLDYFDSSIEPDDMWVTIGGSIAAPDGTTYGRVVMRTLDWQEGIGGALYFDNVSVYDAALYGQAYAPDPVDGATVTVDLAALSWKNHDPNDLFTFDVYLEAEGPVIDPNFTSAPIATGITTNTLNLALAGVTLSDNTVYTWRVDSTDPNNGDPKIFPGVVWTFQIGDVAPVVNAGANQYAWLVGGEGKFTLSGSYTDDGKSTIIRAEYIEGTHQKAGGTTVTLGTPIHDPVAKTVTVDVTVANAVPGQTATGWYAFTLEVEDAIEVGSDAVNAGVYGTCLEAAMADPADTTIAEKWPNGHGDIDGDCDTDIADFALLASSWLDCMTIKAGCNP